MKKHFVSKVSGLDDRLVDCGEDVRVETYEQLNEAVDALDVHESHLEAQKVGPEHVGQVLGVHLVLGRVLNHLKNKSFSALAWKVTRVQRCLAYFV